MLDETRAEDFFVMDTLLTLSPLSRPLAAESLISLVVAGDLVATGLLLRRDARLVTDILRRKMRDYFEGVVF